jgi:septal ring factor EnvC (AmiA/AmiB activator)
MRSSLGRLLMSLQDSSYLKKVTMKIKNLLKAIKDFGKKLPGTTRAVLAIVLLGFLLTAVWSIFFVDTTEDSEITALKSQNATLMNSIKSLREARATLEKDVKKWKDQAAEKDKALAEYEENESELNQTIEELNAKLDTYKTFKSKEECETEYAALQLECKKTLDLTIKSGKFKLNLCLGGKDALSNALSLSESNYALAQLELGKYEDISRNQGEIIDRKDNEIKRLKRKRAWVTAGIVVNSAVWAVILFRAITGK